MIRSILLKNWRSHEETSLEFTEGTNILVGVMGSGKTSVLDAITFALFGTFPALQRRRIKLEDIIRRGADGKAEVVLTIDIQGDAYRITRSIEENSTSARVEKNGSLIEGPHPRRATEYLEHILGIDYDSFSRVIYSEQNGIDYFLTLSPSMRKSHIDNLLGIDRFEKARANITKILNELRKMADEGKKTLSGISEEELEKALREIEKEVEAGEKELGDVRRIADTLSQDFKEIERRLRLLEAAEERHRELESEKIRTASLISQIKAEIERIDEKEYENDVRMLAELREKIKNSSVLLSSLEDELSFLTGKTATLQSRCAELRKKDESRRKLEDELKKLSKGMGDEEIENELMILRKEADSLRERLSESIALRGELENSLKALEENKDICPVCGSEISEEKRSRLIEEKRMKIAELSKKERDFEKKLSNVKDALKEAEDRLAKTRNIRSRLDEIGEVSKEFAAAEREYEKVFSEKQKLAEKRSSLLKELDEIRESERKLYAKVENASSILSKKEKIRELEEKLKEIERELGKLSFNPSELKKARDDFMEKSSELSTVKERYAGIEKNLATKRAWLAERKQRLDEHRKVKQRVEKYERIARDMRILLDGVVETQRILRSEYIEAINATLSEIWPHIYPYRDYTAVRLNATEDDYSLELKSGAHFFPVEGIASGGERACAALALRIAFASVIAPNVGWLILDEPTHNLDNDGVRALTEMLSEKLDGIIEQAFVITHDERLIDAGKTVYRLNRNKNENETTKAERIV